MNISLPRYRVQEKSLRKYIEMLGALGSAVTAFGLDTQSKLIRGLGVMAKYKQFIDLPDGPQKESLMGKMRAELVAIAQEKTREELLPLPRNLEEQFPLVSCPRCGQDYIIRWYFAPRRKYPYYQEVICTNKDCVVAGQHGANKGQKEDVACHF